MGSVADVAYPSSSSLVSTSRSVSSAQNTRCTCAPFCASFATTCASRVAGTSCGAQPRNAPTSGAKVIGFGFVPLLSSVDVYRSGMPCAMRSSCVTAQFCRFSKKAFVLEPPSDGPRHPHVATPSSTDTTPLHLSESSVDAYGKSPRCASASLSSAACCFASAARRKRGVSSIAHGRCTSAGSRCTMCWSSQSQPTVISCDRGIGASANSPKRSCAPCTIGRTTAFGWQLARAKRMRLPYMRASIAMLSGGGSSRTCGFPVPIAAYWLIGSRRYASASYTSPHISPMNAPAGIAASAKRPCITGRQNVLDARHARCGSLATGCRCCTLLKKLPVTWSEIVRTYVLAPAAASDVHAIAIGRLSCPSIARPSGAVGASMPAGAWRSGAIQKPSCSRAVSGARARHASRRPATSARTRFAEMSVYSTCHASSFSCSSSSRGLRCPLRERFFFERASSSSSGVVGGRRRVAATSPPIAAFHAAFAADSKTCVRNDTLRASSWRRRF